MDATYSPEDNKLRLYTSARLDSETYSRVKAAGFSWAPQQELFVAPAWTPQREDLLVELCGEIGDEDTSLVDRAEGRAERFEEYGEARAADAEGARRAVAAIADNIPLGQPILVGHHSERHARKDAERIQNGMRRAVRMWETSQYWKERAAGAIRAAKYKERPDVRARRIKGLEADQRRQERDIAQAEQRRGWWEKWANTEPRSAELALKIANVTLSYDTWKALSDGTMTPEEACETAQRNYGALIAHSQRWLQHIQNRLEYERAMLAESGGTVADQHKPEKGGACRCWASRGGWAYIQKVNKISVTILDNWGNGGRNFTRTIPFDNLKAIMSAAEVQGAREAGRLVETADKTGFLLADAAAAPKPRPEPKPETEFDAMRETLRAGVQVVTAPQLFPTPPELARRMVDVAGVQPGHRVLEPSAGTGNLVAAIINRGFLGLECGGGVVAVEVNPRLAEGLRERRQRTLYANDSNFEVHCADFLACNGTLGQFHRIVMNPPFANGEDIRHVQHALTFLKPGGRLVAICANGPRQQAALRPLADTWEVLPPDAFKESGTGVHAVLLTMEAPEERSA